MKVLLATDGDAPAEAAGRLVERIADEAHVAVTVASVVPHPPLPSPLFEPVMYERAVADAATSLEQAGFGVETRMLQGRPGREIVRLAEEENFDLTVVGGGTKTWLDSVLLGSVSTHVLHASHCSMLIVHDCAPRERHCRVLVGTDGSIESKLAVEAFCEFADPARCDTVVASVVHPASNLVHPFPVPGGYREEELDKHLNEEAQAHAAGATELLRRSAFTARPRVLFGSPSTQLLKEAENLRADLLVVGSRGLGPLGRAAMGSVSDHVARHARAAFVGRHLRD